MRLQALAASQALRSAMPSKSSRASSRSRGRLRIRLSCFPAEGAAAAAQQAQGHLGFSLDLTKGHASGLSLRLPRPKISR